LACSLPEGWQADWSSGQIWITHYNPSGTVADALAFSSLEDLYVWLENHPDCCDVDVDKIAQDVQESAVSATAMEVVSLKSTTR
jgi:hypothetical protein